MADNKAVIKLDIDTSSATKDLNRLSKDMDKIMSSPNADKSLKSLASRIQTTIQTTEILKNKLDATLNSKKHTKTFDEALAKARELKETVDSYTASLLHESKLPITKSNRRRAEEAFLKSTSTKASDVIPRQAILAYREAQEEIAKLVQEGKKFDIDEKSVVDLNAKLAMTDSKLKLLISNYAEIVRNHNTIENRARRVASTMRTWYIIQRELNKATNTLQNAYNKLSGIVKKVLFGVKQLHKTTDRHNTSANEGFRNLFRNVLRYGLGIRSVYFLFRRLRSLGIDAIKELVKVSDDANKSVSRVVQAFNGMKGSIASFIQPLITIFAPVLEKILNLITKIITAFGKLFAMLTGQTFMYTATANTVDYAASLDKTGKSAKKAKKELEGYLSPIDEINKYKEKDKDSGSGDDVGYTLQKTPIDFDDMLSDWIKRFITPLKKAWAKVGDFVKSAWARAFDSLKILAIDVVEDFLDVWNEQKTVEMLETILRIIGRIGTLVDILAYKFDIAWRSNDTGKKILENIRDIFKIIIDHIDSAIAKTQTWAMELNFTPLLEAVESWLQSLEPVVDNIMTVFESFYTTVLLPLSKWAIEKGLPELLDVFTQLNDRLATSGLTEKLQTLWEHLEPFAETVGEGLIQFISELGNKLADFVESDAFNNFIDKLGQWMDKVSADDVANVMWGIINALVGLKIAIAGFTALNEVVTVLGTIQKFISFFGKSGGAASATEGALGLSGALTKVKLAIAGISAPVAIVIGAITLLAGAFVYLWNTNDEFRENITKTWNNIKTTFSKFTGEMSTRLGEFGDKFKPVFEAIWTTVKTIWNKLCDFLAPQFENAFNLVSGILDGALDFMLGTFDMFAGLFTGDWDQFWEGLKNTVKGVVNVIISIVESMVNTIVDGLNALSFDIPWDWAQKVVGSSHIGFNLSKVSIPRLAQGAVIPPNKEFMALLGDQKSGTNIETPLATMVEAFNQALSQQSGAGRTEINFVLPNKQTVAQYVIEGGRVLQMSKGKNPFELA